jgi:hypothetical protein
LRAELVRRAEDWRWGSLNRWLHKPERDPPLVSPWPLARPPRWAERVNQPLTGAELHAVRTSVNRGTPFGDQTWVQRIAQELNLQSTLRPRGRPKKSPDTFFSQRHAVLFGQALQGGQCGGVDGNAVAATILFGRKGVLARHQHFLEAFRRR